MVQEEAPDSTLVARSRQGDAAAFEALVRRYLKGATAVGLSVLRSVADAEDVAQDAFVTAWESLDTCREPGRFAAWLFTIVRNKARNRLAQRRPGEVVEEQGSSGEVERLVVRAQLLAALSKLNDVQREVVLLHDLEAWTHAEIAAALDLSEVNARQHLFVARKLLRACLTGQDHA
jgi:RNA polymerase sigma-70 factor (ECF subfamily)